MDARQSGSEKCPTSSHTQAGPAALRAGRSAMPSVVRNPLNGCQFMAAHAAFGDETPFRRERLARMTRQTSLAYIWAHLTLDHPPIALLRCVYTRPVTTNAAKPGRLSATRQGCREQDGPAMARVLLRNLQNSMESMSAALPACVATAPVGAAVPADWRRACSASAAESACAPSPAPRRAAARSGPGSVRDLARGQSL